MFGFRLKVSFVFLIVVPLMAHRGAIAQKVEVSAQNLDDFSLGYTKVIGLTDSGFFLLSGSNSYEVGSGRVGFKNPKYKVGFMGHDLNLKWNKPLETPNPNAIIRMVDCIDERIVVLLSNWDKTQSVVSIQSFTIDSQGTIDNQTEICSISGFTKEPIYYGVSLSLHKEKLAFYAVSESENGLQISFSVCSRDLQLVSTMSGTIKQPAKNFSIEQLVVSDAGAMMLLGLRSDKVKALSMKRENNWFAYTVLNGEFSEIPIGRGIELPFLNLTIDEFRSEAVLTGMFSDKESYVGAGILYGRMAMENDSIPQINSISIDASQNLRLKGTRNNGTGAGLSDFPIRKVIPRGDGGAVLVAESAFTNEYSYFDSFSQTYTRRLEYNFGDIVLFSITADGKIQWSASVNKEQISLDDGGIFSSYCMMIGSHSLDFIFSEPISKRAKVLKGSISHIGVPQKILSLSLSEGTQLLPEGARQVSENEMVVPAVFKRKLHMLRLTF